jgi:hypothetical protein
MQCQIPQPGSRSRSLDVKNLDGERDLAGTGRSTDNDFASDPSPVPPSTLRAHAVLDVALTVPYAEDAALIISAYVPGPVASRCLCPGRAFLAFGLRVRHRVDLGLRALPNAERACVFRRHRWHRASRRPALNSAHAGARDEPSTNGELDYNKSRSMTSRSTLRITTRRIGPFGHVTAGFPDHEHVPSPDCARPSRR